MITISRAHYQFYQCEKELHLLLTRLKLVAETDWLHLSYRLLEGDINDWTRVLDFQKVADADRDGLTAALRRADDDAEEYRNQLRLIGEALRPWELTEDQIDHCMPYTRMRIIDSSLIGATLSGGRCVE